MDSQDDVGEPISAEPRSEAGADASLRLAEGNPEARWKWASKLVLKLRWQAYWFAPNLLAGLDGDDKASKAARDEERNRESRVPQDQALESRMAWGVELYGPGEIDTLYESLDSLGWSGIGGSSAEGDAASSVRRMRSKGGGAWLNLGYVFRRGSRKRSFLSKNFTHLPDDVESLKVNVFQITDSMTAVLIGFSLSGSLVEAYARELNRDRSTYYQRKTKPKSIEWVGPLNQKEAAIARRRTHLRSMVGQWFADHLPGFFSGLQQPSSFPTMELVAANSSAFVALGQSMPHFENWRRLLINVRRDEVLTEEERPALKLAFFDSREMDQGLHIFASVDTTLYDNAPLDGAEAPSRRKPTMHCHDVAGGVLVHSATLQYLKEHMKDIHRTRERMKEARSGRRSTSRTISEITQFFDRNIGLPAVTRDLARHSKHVHWYRHDCGRFSAKSWQGDKTYFFFESIQKRLQSLSAQLTDEEAAIRSHFEQLTSILSVRESIKAQRRMEVLTVSALVVAVGSLVVALPKWDSIAKTLQDAWQALMALASH
ncbi:hypothetical protein [Stenotrophomonas bentonitica]|uniref:hypothetical protein n=1 Tax=Stenotrophomonas bentonitica TaxID=1450134 RepID=UPI0011AED610|nr:hypothetical protein [Stenotrophomonas bentonitica]